MFVRNGVALGSVITVPDEDEEDYPEGYTLPTPAPEPEPEPEPEAAAEVEAETVAETEEQPEPVEMPSHSDLKKAWVDYAVSKGYSKEEAEALNKQDLIEIFSE